MKALPVVFVLLANIASFAADPVSSDHPARWAAPIVETTLENGYRVSDDLFRSAQPKKRDIPAMKALEIRTILNLRSLHEDSDAFARAGFTRIAQEMEADDLTLDDLVAALRQYRDAQKPVLVHCWHGSDRTGAFVAAYRIAFEGWSRAAALDEFRRGGFGYHESWYPNLKQRIETIDEAELRRRVRE